MLLSQIATFLVLAPFIIMTISSCLASRTKSRRFAFWGAMVGVLVAAFGATIIMDWNISLTLFGYLSVTPLSAFFIFLASLAIALVEILAFRYSEQFPEFAFTMALSFIGMFFIATAQSLLPILIGLEVMTVSTTFMILVHGKRRAEAAVKLFIFGSLAIAVFSFAAVLIFNYNPSLALSEIAAGSGYIAMASLALFLVALGFETGIYPFNLWVPDVYQGAPPFVTAAIAGINKKIAFLALIEILFFVFAVYVPSYYKVIEILAIVTMFFGNILALKQPNLKRMFAYLSFSQAGYILIGVAAASTAGLTASLFYIFAHTFMIIGAFAIVGFLESHGINSVDDCNSALFKERIHGGVAYDYNALDGRDTGPSGLLREVHALLERDSFPPGVARPHRDTQQLHLDILLWESDQRNVPEEERGAPSLSTSMCS